MQPVPPPNERLRYWSQSVAAGEKAKSATPSKIFCVHRWSSFLQQRWFIASAWLAGSPDWAPVSKNLAWVLSLSLLVAALWRFKQGFSLVRYQRNLRVLRHYTVKPAEIPWSNDVLYLGMGFRWTALHTRRLHQAAMNPANRRLTLNLPRIYQALRRFERVTEHYPSDSVQRI